MAMVDQTKYGYFSVARQLLEERQDAGNSSTTTSTTSSGDQLVHFECAGHSFLKLHSVFLSDRHFEEYLNYLPLPSRGATVLEVGSGTGWALCSLYLRNRAAIREVLASDINPTAVENTRMNMLKHGVPGEVRLSDVFSDVSKQEKFDLIFWNVPFYHVPAQEELSLLDRSIADAGYNSIERYIRDAGNHVTASGKVAILFSPDCGNMRFLRHVADRHGKRLDVIWRSHVGGGQQKYDVLFELYLVTDKLAP